MKYLKRMMVTLILIFYGALISACISIKVGSPLVTEGLDALQLGESTRADVLLALGQPRGHGSVLLSQDPYPRDIVFYEFMQSDGKNVELEILLVFVREEAYDGYLWFASSERIRTESDIPLLVMPESVAQGYFPHTGPLESRFVRGQTTGDEVLEALLQPTGIGAAILPPLHEEQTVMFYEDIEMEDMNSVGGELVADFRQRILLVLLTDNVYDGFMWYSNGGLLEARTY
jgi:hypothetical protein